MRRRVGFSETLLGAASPISSGDFSFDALLSRCATLILPGLVAALSCEAAVCELAVLSALSSSPLRKERSLDMRDVPALSASLSGDDDEHGAAGSSSLCADMKRDGALSSAMAVEARWARARRRSSL